MCEGTRHQKRHRRRSRDANWPPAHILTCTLIYTRTSQPTAPLTPICSSPSPCSCLINEVQKPGDYVSEHELFTMLEGRGGTPCTRYYYLRWYSELTKALGGPLGAPAGRPAPAVNMTVMRERPREKVPVSFTSRR